MSINLTAIHKSAKSSMTSGLKNRDLFRAAFESIDNKDDFKAARIAWTNHAFEVMRAVVGPDKADAEYARTLFYRELANSGLKAPGKNAGKRLAQAEKLDYSLEALIAAYKASDWQLCRRIVNAAEQAKAEQDAKTPEEPTTEAAPDTVVGAAPEAPAAEAEVPVVEAVA